MSNAVIKEGNVLDRVVNGGYCVGCGGCAYVSSAVSMAISDTKQYIPVRNIDSNISASELEAIANVCPFSGEGENENQLADRLYGGDTHHPEIGFHRDLFAGRVKNDDFYIKGSSGGIGKWLLTKLLDLKEVDYVIQVAEPPEGKTSDDNLIYGFQVFTDSREILRGSKSAYYPIEMSHMLDFIKQNEGRFAVTGIPCFVKMLRRLSQQDPIIKERVKFAVSIICGHLKSAAYAEMIGWQLGVKPDELAGIDFRKKIEGKKANEKGVQATSHKGELSRQDIVQNIYGTNYGFGFFKYSACDYCDDVVGETGDVSIGDAWLPEYLNQGTSLVIVRSESLKRIFEENIDELSASKVSAQQAADSQRSGLRHRRDYLKYRLFLKEKLGKWFPEKRVMPQEDHLSSKAKKVVEVRMELSEKSHGYFLESKQKDDFGYFERKTLPYVIHLFDLNKSYVQYLFTRLLRKFGVYSLLIRLLKK